MKGGRPWWLDQIGCRSLLEIAHHECAHATVAWITGREIERLSMVTDAQFAMLRNNRESPQPAGCIVLAPLPAGVNLHEKKYRVLAEREMLIALAGGVAMSRLVGGHWTKNLSRGDLEGLAYYAADAGESRKSLSSHLDRLASRVAFYLDVFWGHVEALADALLRHRELTGRQVTSFLSKFEMMRPERYPCRVRSRTESRPSGPASHRRSRAGPLGR